MRRRRKRTMRNKLFRKDEERMTERIVEKMKNEKCCDTVLV